MNIYLVTVDDYEDATIIGVYSTEEAAKRAAASIDLIDYGRWGPYVFAMEVDPPKPTPVAPDGDPVGEERLLIDKPIT